MDDQSSDESDKKKKRTSSDEKEKQSKNHSDDRKNVSIKPEWIAIIIASVSAILSIGIWSGQMSVRFELEKDTMKRIKSAKEDALNEIDERATVNLPIGTIIASMLRPDDFFEKYEEKYWSLADSSEVKKSEYEKITGSKYVPDLQGMFLRGLNVDLEVDGKDSSKCDPDWRFRVPGNIAGSYQADEMKTHYHEGTTREAGKHIHRIELHAHPHDPDFKHPRGYPDISEHIYEKNYFFDTDTGGTHRHTFETLNYGGSETRPKNVAVYWYIKIN